MNICKNINCPYFNENNNGYGCQRYQVSNHCHLIQQFPEVDFNPNQYALANNKKLNLAELKKTNNNFFTNDQQYKDDLAFVENHQDWFSESMWRVSTLSSD